jgi:hypothetical protein
VRQVHQLGHGHGFFAVLEQRNFIHQLFGTGVQVRDGLLIGQCTDQIDKFEVVVDVVLPVKMRFKYVLSLAKAYNILPVCVRQN